MSLTPKIKNKRIPKKAVQGEILLNRCFERNYDMGAYYLEILGIQGSGKTSLMLGMATKMMRIFSHELIFWREPVGSPCQFPKIGDKWQILVEKNYPLNTLEITNKLQPINMKIKYFDNLDELLDIAKPKTLNVVYFKDMYKWIDLLLLFRNLSDFQTVFIDEFEDIAPQRCRGKVWGMNEKLANNLKQLRKSRVNLITNSQNGMDIDFRIRSKRTHTIYLYGSRVDKLSPINKRAIHKLSIGTGWIDFGNSLFGQFSFPPFKPMKQIYMIQEMNIV